MTTATLSNLPSMLRPFVSDDDVMNVRRELARRAREKARAERLSRAQAETERYTKSN